MRSFEFVEGSSAKFGEIERDGCDEPVPAVVDEDVLVLPQAWVRHRAVRRGSAEAGRFTPGPKARATVDADIAKGRSRLDRILTARTTEEPTRVAAMEWLDGSPGAGPLGAAAVAAVLRTGWWETTGSAAPHADVWVAEHGVRFAAEAAVTMMALTLEDDYAPPYPRSTANDKPGVRHRRPDETKSSWIADKQMQLLMRVRQALASASPQEHAEVVSALRPYRVAHPYARAATAVLVPGERAWFEEDLRSATVTGKDAYSASLLLFAASTPEDVQALLTVAPAYLLINSMPLLVTLLDGVGPGIAPALFQLLDGNLTAEYQRRLLDVLTVIPGDETTSGLIERADAKYVMPALLEHADRFPARSLRLLAEAADRGDVANLLRGHLLKHRHLAGQAMPHLSAEAAERVERILAEATAVAAAPLSAVPRVLADPSALDAVKVPEIPAWASPGLLRPVMLRDGSGALPEQAVANLVALLAMSRTGAPHQGLDTVRETCEPSSLATFAWSLFEQWRAAGMPHRETWALEALALLGDDETVRRLTPLILVWPGENGHRRAVAGLAVLSAIGSDVALMHLHSIAQRSRFTGLKNAARQRMDSVANALGLTAEQLADRLVPDFGLEDDGSLRLDYGPRQFVVGFDEQLRPFVADADGKRLKALPKPGARDDTTLAPAAHQRFAALKKDVRTIAADQVRRLEQAMVAGRRWSATEFRKLFVDHPLLRHIVRRLVWVTFDAGTPPGSPARSFRVAEDRSFSTVDDEETVLAEDAVVALAHPLHLGADVAAWGEVFADYEILQPFPQLGRPVLTLAEEERTVSRLVRFEGLTVPATKLLGLERRGWRRETPQDAGVQSRIEFAAGGGFAVAVEFEPGIAVGAVGYFPEQKLTEVFVHDGTARRWGAGNQGHVPVSRLDPVTVSEILRDLTDLTT